MNIFLNAEMAEGFKSRSQVSRIVTEAWAGKELYCPECLAPNISATPNNTRAVDFVCKCCQASFQLKSSRSNFYNNVPDGAYKTMLSAINESRAPNLLLMTYSPTRWTVNDLIWIPYFALTEHVIIPRKPLSVNARRAGWVGCNINLSRIATTARISMVVGGHIVDRHTVNSRYKKISPLKELKPRARGWTMAVLNEILKSGWKEFTTRQAYCFEEALHMQFPGNSNVRAKIRQQLQVLRDLKILDHLSQGCWRYR